ncbi:response regulator transcription factor family protein [Streptomyces sp. NL15-2K]|uniref:helix-turn-helix transcriptional regulator n=1 Tax=Streptomyces sp. NL15-2K TaxID=376149 RepID=UPI000F5896F1|nr:MULTISPECIES: response regulator transcription factor family protein [Actinomycetes]WKX15880.1 LuxR C-terminal-related transcriptional regulator [Kutzneria buriramensis]GCB42729.1 luxR family transcriptional regulator [Streptomyces sp. NL15-2K]
MNLTAAADIIRAPLGEILPRLSAALADAVPHRALAELSGSCARSPVKIHTVGADGTWAVTAAELAALTKQARPGRPWQGQALVAGTENPVLAVASDEAERDALLVLLRSDEAAIADPDLTAVQTLWDLLTAYSARIVSEAVPGPLALSRVAAGARAAAIAELVDTHGGVLSGLLGALRRRDLDNHSARERAIDLALSALAELRAGADQDRALAEEAAGDGFARLADSLQPMFLGRGVRLDLGPPGTEEGADRHLPADVAHVARAALRSVVSALLDGQGPGSDSISRVHIGWKVAENELRATVRDDGPGVLSRAALENHWVVERLAVLDGRLEVDAVPGWGTTVTATLPLEPPQGPRNDPLTVLGAREVEVLGHLARGRRNRHIAEELHISESTVKFHVANILDKLGVDTRGEAAALAHTWGVDTA